MENGAFADAYRTQSPRTRYKSESYEIGKFMNSPREWAAIFGHYLLARMQDGDIDNKHQVRKDIDAYTSTENKSYLDDATERSRDVAYYDSDNESVVNEMNFHIMNSEFGPVWNRLLLPELQMPLAADQIETIQTKIAIQAAKLIKVSREIAQEASNKGIRSTLPLSIGGQLTEIDAAIAMLEMTKDDSFEDEPHLIVVPAPTLFESVQHNKQLSSDFIFLDTVKNMSRGIQVKTSIDYFPSFVKREYDARYVTLIDGMIDLGNTRPGEGTYGRSTGLPFPGMLSLDFLKLDVSVHKASANPAFKDDLGDLIEAKEIAAEPSSSKSSYLQQAKKNIQGRILHDLYK
jgi:hypothetical protein